MRRIPEELQERLDSGATSLCRCWKVTRSDGREYGFTDHDLPLEFDGCRFAANSGLDASALQTSNGLNVDNGQATGALSSDALNEEEIAAGKFDRAEVRQWLVDWQRPDLRVLMFRGRLGEIRRTDGRFEVELRGLAEDLNVPVGRSILRTCDRALGDAKCGFHASKAGFSGVGSVLGQSNGSRLVAEGLEEFEENWFLNGTLTWSNGRNAGDMVVVRSDTTNGNGDRSLRLWKSPSFPVEKGDRFRVVAGCDKQADTCRAKFDNMLNFGGFPHIPGEDWVTAYPKQGVVHDGSSLRNG